MRVVLSEFAEFGLKRLNIESERSDALRLAILHFLSKPEALRRSQPLLGPDHSRVLFYPLQYWRITWEPGEPALVWTIGWLSQYDPDRTIQ